MAIERRVTELAGEAGGRLHTARSRNDQVATDMAMFTRRAAHRCRRRDRSHWCETLIDAAPSTTSTGRCPATRTCSARSRCTSATTCWPTHGCCCATSDGFAAVLDGTAALPLGAGALAGVNFDTDRTRVAAELGFAGRGARTRSTPSPTATSCSTTWPRPRTCATHLSRLGAEIVLWSSEEFGFCEVADAWASGSSIMPQKKNPDAAELLRAKAPRIVGHLAALHGVMHGLPLTYNKDMQEDKEHLFDAVDTLELALAAAHGMLEHDHVRPRAPGRCGRGRDARGDRRRRPARPARACRSVRPHGVVAGLVRVAVERAGARCRS